MMARTYSSYKPSEIAWLGQIPSHWSVDRLKWSTDAPINGVWGAEPDGDNDVACIRVADFDRQAFRVCADQLTYRAIPSSDCQRRLLGPGDILIEKSGGGEKQLVGAVVEWNIDIQAVTSNFVAKMTCRPGMVPRFWIYMHAHLYAGRVNYPAIKQTTGIQNLDSEAYLNERVAYPTEAEQVTIADFLDRETARIDSLVAKKRRLLLLLEEKRLAVITEAVTKGLDPNRPMKDSGSEWIGDVPTHWGVRKIKYAVTNVVDCLHTTPHYDGELVYPAVRTSDVDRGRLLLEHARLVSEDVYQERIQRLKPECGDVLYSREGERFGMAALVPACVDLCLGQRMMMFRVKADVLPAYFMWALNSEAIYQQVILYMGGSTSPHINIQDIINFSIPHPPFNEQLAVAEHIAHECERLERVSSCINAALEALLEYRAALITNAVTGKIDVSSYARKEAAE